MSLRNKLYEFIQEFRNKQSDIILANYNRGVVLESITLERDIYSSSLRVSVVLFDEYNYSQVKHVKFSLDKSIYPQIYLFLKWFSEECDLNFPLLESLVTEYWGEEGFNKTVKKLQIELLLEKLSK